MPPNMGLVMHTLKMVPQTSLWQAVSKGTGCCVSPVTVILLMSMGCLTWSYAYQAFIVPCSAGRMLTFQRWYPLLGQENAYRKDGSMVYSWENICILHRRSETSQNIPEIFPLYIFELWMVIVSNASPGTILSVSS